MADTTEQKALKPELRDLMIAIIRDISSTLSLYLNVPAYDEDRINEIVDWTLNGNADTRGV